MKEIWKDIEEYEGLYKISNTGKVKSLIKNKILKPKVNNKNNGYILVNLYKDKISKNYYIHRLVAKHFLSDWNEELLVDHINNIRTDNHVENLRMVTPMENNYNPNSTICKQCKIIFNDNTEKVFSSQTKAAEFLAIDNTTLCNIMKGKYNIPKKYNFKKVEYI